MKNGDSRIYAVLSIVISATILATLMLPIGLSIETHGHMDVTEEWWGAYANRCDHLVDPPGANASNAFTGCGLVAYNQSDAWINCTYIFLRGFGGPDENPHTWNCTGYSMSCGHTVNQLTTYYHYPYEPTYWDDGGPMGEWDGWYNPILNIVRTGLDAEKVGVRTASYFRNHTGPSPYIYISSTIQSYYLVAGSVIEEDTEW